MTMEFEEVWIARKPSAKASLLTGLGRIVLSRLPVATSQRIAPLAPGDEVFAGVRHQELAHGARRAESGGRQFAKDIRRQSLGSRALPHRGRRQHCYQGDGQAVASAWVHHAAVPPAQPAQELLLL